VNEEPWVGAKTPSVKSDWKRSVWRSNSFRFRFDSSERNRLASRNIDNDVRFNFQFDGEGSGKRLGLPQRRLSLLFEGEPTKGSLASSKPADRIAHPLIFLFSCYFKTDRLDQRPTQSTVYSIRPSSLLENSSFVFYGKETFFPFLLCICNQVF